MSKRKILPALLLLCSLLFNIRSHAQTYYDLDGSDYVLIDPTFIRGALGFSEMNLFMKNVVPRHASGIYMRNEVRIISAFMKPQNRFVLRDAFYLDLTLGKLTSTPLTLGGYVEGKFCAAFTFGYDLLAGYRNDDFGLLGGIRLQWACNIIGGSDMPGSNLLEGAYPLMLRAEYRIADADEFRICLTGYDNFNKDKAASGFNIDIPFSKKRRLYFTFEYRHESGDAAPANYDNYKYTTGSIDQWMVGLRAGSIY